MTRPLLLAAFLTLTTLPAMADSPYEAFEFTGSNGKVLPCRLLKPAGYDPNGSEKYPVVVFLHGAGERGSDNNAQLVHCCGRFLEDDLRTKHPCFVLAPQCPKDEKWANVDWSSDHHSMMKEPSSSMQLVIEVLDKLEKEYRIDTDREYVMGLSMGGYGTWDLVSRMPTRFAAAVPICGGADEAQAPKIAKLPVWVFHGDKDGAVKVIRSQRMVAALKEAGGTPKYTEYPGVGHNSWTPAMQEPGLFDWLFAQHRASE